MPSIKELTESRNKLLSDNRKLLDLADTEKRTLTSEEQKNYDQRDLEVDQLSDQIKALTDHENRKQRLAAAEEEALRPLPRQTAPSATKPNGEGTALSFDFGRCGQVTLQPSDPLYKRATPDYHARFLSYISGRAGNVEPEQLGLFVGSDPQGGALVPVGMIATFIKFLDNEVFMRRLGTVLPPTTAKTVGALSYDTDYGDADWTAEVPASDLSEDTAARFGTREMTPHLLTKLVKASMKLVRGSTLPIETFLMQRLAYLFGITEENKYLNGSGAQQPLGIFTASANGVTTSQDITCASGTAFTGDELINCLYDLKDAYVQRATWIATREFRKRCRKLKTGDGNYLLVENNAQGPTTILERPLVVSEYAPSTYTSGLYVAAVGDLSYYWIQDGMGMEIQYLDQLFALKNQVGWVGRKETDGMPVLAEAFRRLKLG